MVSKREAANIIIVVLGLAVLMFRLEQVRTLADGPLPVTSEEVAGADVSVPANRPAFGMQFRGFSGQFQQLLDIEANGSPSNNRTVFSIAGGIFGLAFIEDTLYGTECDNPCGSTNNYYLVTLPHVGTVTGARVGATPIGFSNVEGLAYCPADGKLYGTSFNFSSPHLTTLIAINPTTGVGSAIGTLSPDVRIVGLACHPVSGTLYGISIPHATNATPKLYTINRTTAGETPVGGGLGVTLQGLAWDDELDRLIGGFEKLYAINTATGAATEIGGDYTTGAAGDGVYGLAYLTHIIPLTLNKALDSTSVVTASATITYTITIMNNGANPVTNTTVSDAIPANATYNPGSATANPAIALTNFPGVTPPFTISAGSGVVITYTLEVTGAAKRGDVLTNTATVSAPALSTVLTDSETNLVDPLKTFLPMVFNQQ